MAQHPQLGDLFRPCELLPVGTRRHLAGLLARPGRAPALLPEDLRACPLTAAVEGRLEAARVIETGLTPGVLAALAPWRVRDVVPVLAGTATAGLPPTVAPRTRAILERNAIGDDIALGDCTVAHIRSWAGVGAAMAASIVGVALQAGATAPAAAIEAAADRDHAAEWDESVVLRELDAALAAIGDERDLGVFELRSLRLSNRPHLRQVGDALGVCDERVRQLQRGAERRMREAIGACPRVRDEVAALTRALGEAATVRAIDALLASRGLPALPDVRSLALVWAAGPYQPLEAHPGWVAVEPAELLAETRRMLREDGGVHSIDHLSDDLSAIGLAPDLVDEWLLTQPVHRHHDLVVLVAGPTGQVIERALSASGRAMTVTELAVWVGSAEPSDAAAQVSAVLERDRRFVRVGPGLYELTEWGSPPADDLAGDDGGEGDAADQHALREDHGQTDLSRQDDHAHRTGDHHGADDVGGQSDEEGHDDARHGQVGHGGQPKQEHDDHQPDHRQLVLVGFDSAGRPPIGVENDRGALHPRELIDIPGGTP